MHSPITFKGIPGNYLRQYQEQLLSNILDADGINLGIAIYRNNFIQRHIKALRCAYPMMRRLVGEQFFTAMAREYVLQNQQSTRYLFNYGADLADFIGAFEPAQSLPYLSEMAQLEWAYHQAYYAPNPPPIPWDFIANLSRQEIRLQLVDGVRVLDCQFPVLQIWQACVDDSSSMVELNQQGDCLVVYRQNLVVQLQKIENAEYQWLLSIQEGLTFDECCQIALTCNPDYNLDDGLVQLVQRSILQVIVD